MKSSITRIQPKEYFEGRLEDAQVLADQNARFMVLLEDEALNTPGAEDFFAAASDGLYEEQRRTIDNLLDETNSPYTELYEEYQRLIGERDALLERIGTCTQEAETKKAHIHDLAQRSVELAPLAEASVAALEYKKCSEIDSAELNAIRTELDTINLQIEKIEGIYNIAGNPWPIPQILGKYSVDLDEQLTVIDEIPVEPETHASPDDISEGLKERHGYRHGASLTLVSFLIQHQGEVFLPQELATVVYTDESFFSGMTDAQREHNRNLRIHKLLNKSEYAIGVLREEGYTLQYGWRHFIDPKTDKPTQRKRRIYRVVESGEADETTDYFVETVDPNDESAQIPRVLTREMLGFRNDQAMSDSRQEELEYSEFELEVIEHVDRAIQELDEHGLMPEEYDSCLKVMNVRNLLLTAFGNRRKARSPKRPYIRSLYDAAFSSNPHNESDAADIVMASIRHSMRNETVTSETKYTEALRIVQGILEEFYISDDPQNEDI